jgi:hypothetical protein
MLNFRKEQPGRFGTHPVYVDGAVAAITVNATTTQTLTTPNVKALISALSVQTFVVPADDDGTILAKVFKWDKSAGAAVALTGNVDLETLTAKSNTSVPLLATLTPADLTIDPGDTLYVTVTNNSAAIGTQPTGLRFQAEIFILV